MQRFQREAQTVAGLHHTNIVPIFAIGSEDATPYYAMQFIEGRSLAQIAADAATAFTILPSEQVADWGLQAAEALAHAHARGVIHRDIKPSNLILDPEGRIWLTDFGLAKRAEDVTLSLTGALLGTPRYMSPEQASSLTQPVDHRTDIYSLGATLYELATGQPIFQANSPDKISSRPAARPGPNARRAGPANTGAPSPSPPAQRSRPRPWFCSRWRAFNTSNAPGSDNSLSPPGDRASSPKSCTPMGNSRCLVSRFQLPSRSPSLKGITN
jgi:serine/threonine protein kinase